MLGINPATQSVQPQPAMKARCCDGENCACQKQNVEEKVQDSFTRQGIIPPRDYKPDKFAGLGKPVEMTPQEKLKKKWEDFRRPMYIAEEVQTTTVQPVGEDMQSYTVKTIQVVTPKMQSNLEKTNAEKPTFGQKVKNFFKKMFGIKSTKDLVAQIPEQTTTIAEKQDTLNTVKQIKRSGGTKEQKQYWGLTSQILDKEIQRSKLSNEIELLELQREQVAREMK